VVSGPVVSGESVEPGAPARRWARMVLRELAVRAGPASPVTPRRGPAALLALTRIPARCATGRASRDRGPARQPHHAIPPSWHVRSWPGRA